MPTEEEILAERKAKLFADGLESVRAQQTRLIASLELEIANRQSHTDALKLQLEDAKLGLEELNARLPAPSQNP